MHRFGLVKQSWHVARRRGIGRSMQSCLARVDWQQQAPLVGPLLATSDNNDSNDEVLDQLERDIALYNHGKPLNVNSPKQVSMAIFGSLQSTSRQVLLKASQGEGIEHERQQKLAKLVLEHRALSSKIKQRQRSQMNVGNTSNSFSTLATDETETEANDVILQEEQVNLNGRVVQPLSRDETLLGDSDATPIQSSTFHARTGVQGSFGQAVDNLFDSRKSKLNSFWKDYLLQVTKPSAQNMVQQLNAESCPMGYDPSAAPGILRPSATSSEAGKKGSLLHYVRQQKEKYPDCIILTRVGEFYETYGLDAVMLVEHCGLNAMAGKARAGCPVRNVQATLDCLTSKGFRVAVYEEAADTDSSSGSGASAGTKSRLKNRMLAQVVSPASPTYLYDLVLAGNADALVTSPASRQYIGVLESAAGYTLVQVNTEEQSVRVSDRLTAEAVACHLAAYPPADPLIYVPSSEKTGSTSLPFLPSRTDSASEGPGSRPRLKILPASLVEEATSGVSDIERARRTVVGALLQMMERNEDDNESVTSVDDFVLVAASSSTMESFPTGTQTNPLYVETATQLGLMNDKTIPPLVSYLLPESAPAATRRFLRRWLLTPPSPAVADSMSSLVTFLMESGPPLPPLSVPPIGKVLALLRAGQASAQVYGELLAAMDATIAVLDMLDSDIHGDHVVAPLMNLLEFESGMAADPASLRSRCVEAMQIIEDVISPIHHVGNAFNSAANDAISDYNDVIPRAFFERNEASWRGRVQATAADESYTLVKKTAAKLARAVAVDFWGMDEEASMDDILEETSRMKSPIVQDVFNNIFALKELPSWLGLRDDDAKSEYFHPRDRNGKLLRNRYTSTNVQSSLSDYVAACDRACLEVTSVLTQLSQTLCESGHLPAVVQAAHANLILSTAANHAANANALGWNSVDTYEPSGDYESAGHLHDVWPYWMDRNEAVSNSFNLEGLFILTAPNMSGKSTIMRSTATAALLANCGLCAPVGPNSRIQRFDNIFVRGASADIPTECKSAFGAEMGDIAALLRSCGDKSLVFVDELGRGTSPRDGTCLAGAVLEAMAEAGMSGVFATHLHDILDLPLKRRDRIAMKRMAFEECTNEAMGTTDYVWTYKMEDGFCTNSLALVTAAKFGLPESILERAQYFGSTIADGPTRATLTEDVNQGIDASVERITKTTERNGSESIPTPDVAKNLQDAIQFAEQVVGHDRAIRIPPQWSSPPALEGRSCVYILELCNNLENDGGTRFYVGETDSLRLRLSQHRSKGGDWKYVTAAALPVQGGKSQARLVESLLIRKLAKAGFRMESTADGRSVRSNSIE